MNQERKDVTITVNRLNLNNRTPEDTMAEKAIIEAMSKKEVRVVIMHKPTESFAQFKCKLPEIRNKAMLVIEHHASTLHVNALKDDVKLKDYVLLEIEADDIRVTHL